MEPYNNIVNPLVKEMSSDEEKYFNIPTYRKVEELRNIIEAKYPNILDINFEEKEKGSIEIGKFADFIILDNDIITSSEVRIPLTNIVATFVNGELVFNRRFN